MLRVEAIEDLDSPWLVRWLALLLFIIAATPVENARSDLANLFRLIGVVLFFLVFIYHTRFVFMRSALVTVIVLCGYFVVINIFYEDYTNYIFVTLVSIVTCLLISSSAALDDRYSRFLSWVLTGYIYVNLAAFAAVGLWYLATGNILDLHEIFFPFSESRQGFYITFVRLSGLHVEPGTYSNYIYAAVLMRSMLIRRIGTPLHVVAISSSILTFAMTGILISAVFFVAVWVEIFSKSDKNLRFRLLIWAIFFVGIISIIAYLFTSDAILDYIFARMTLGEEGSGSLNLRRVLLHNLLDTFSTGAGVLVGAPLGQSFCRNYVCEHSQDLGTLLILSYNFGIFVVLSVGLWTGIRLVQWGGVATVIVALPFVFSKMDVYDPVTWFLIGVLIFVPRPKHSNSTKENYLVK